MNRIKIVAGAFVAATLLTGAPSAPAADVTVRVEGLEATLVPRTAVRTTDAPVVKDGTHSCPGSSAAGALELATAGDWSGTWSDQFSTYNLERIKTAEHKFFSGHYWSFFVGDEAQETGICAREIAAGEEVLFAPQSETGPAPGVLRLRDVPSGPVTPGQSVTVRVMRTVSEFPPPNYAKTVTTQPASGATVSGEGLTLTTDADGYASFVTAGRGSLGLRATKDGDIRSATETVCVSDGADGACGTKAPGPPVAPCRTDGRDGLCGSPDHKAAAAVVRSVTEQQRFAAGKGPRELQGTVEVDGSGVSSVRLRLVRNDRGACARFDDDKLAFRPIKACRATAGKWVTVGSTADWKYLLPARVTRGRYVLDVEVRDKAGNVNRIWQRGRNRVVFHVA